MNKNFILFFCIGLLVQGCGKEKNPARTQWISMGTIGAVQCAAPSEVSTAREICQSTFETIERSMSTWREDSELSAVNRAAGSGRAVVLSLPVAEVLGEALVICRESEGAFNPLVGPVMQVWGFNGGTLRPAPPDEATLKTAMAQTDWKELAFNVKTHPPEVTLLLPGMRLDLGAIAKGYAVDCAWERLKDAGRNHFLVDLGGNLRACGEAVPGRGGWRTGIRNPFVGTDCLAQFLLKNGEAVATSGNYERFVEIGGVRYAHIMDPRTARPVSGMAGVTVIAPTAMLADALSTTLFVMGSGKGAQLLARHPGCEALWIPDTPDKVTIIATQGFARRLVPEGATPFTLQTVDNSVTP